MSVLNSPIAWGVVALLAAACFIFFDTLCKLVSPTGLKGLAVFPDSSPLTGDLPKLASWIKNKRQLSSFFDHAAEKLGDICQIRVGLRASSGFVVVADFQEMEDILLRRTQEFDRADDTINVFSPVMSTAQICLPTNDMWKHHRRLVGPAMTSKYLSLTTPRANAAVASLVDLWKVKAARLGKGDAAPGRCFEAQQDLEWATLDAICDIALGESWNCVKTAMDQVNATPADPAAHEPTEKGEVVFNVTPPELFTAVSYIFSSFPTLSPMPAISHFITRTKPTYQKHHKALFGFLTDRFASSRKTASGRGEEAAELADSTLDMITARENKGNGDFMSDKEMRDELFQFLVAGAETTAVTLSWWVKYMAANPDIQRKLRNYLRKTMPEFDDRPPAYADVSTENLPYLEAVAWETLRLAKTAGAVTRQATVDTEILGKFIPKGTTLLLTMSRIATIDASTQIVSLVDPSKTLSAPEAAAELDPLRSKTSRAAGRKVGFWEAGTAFQFNPDRWLSEDGSFNPNAGPMLPFSLGQRGCFGKNLANLELKLFIAQLTLAFFFEPVPKELDSYEGIEVVARHPEHGFVRPVPWSEVAGTRSS